ncbi:molybdate ABC transporter substrate-binding protein [Sphingomonas sp. DT-207]|uniref:molybdate ABC transporter substrate-binding protein n=1 Tax=Sphingomonas sp. DT-207 TaxID=3396167 RepID=UPI003F541E27
MDRRYLLGGLGFAALGAGALAWGWRRGETQAPLVLAAASLQDAMRAAADAWAAKGHTAPVCSFAASSALARQILAGARADLFVSADEPWMDEVERAGRIVAGTRSIVAGNALVIVRPAGAAVEGPVLGGGRIAIADPDAVPAGRYAKAALEHLGLWEQAEPRLVRAENVRATLALVERGAAQWGLVYATDARASDKVQVAQVLPAESHPPIRYPVARLSASRSPDAEPFRQFLLAPEGQSILRRFGFTAP